MNGARGVVAADRAGCRAGACIAELLARYGASIRIRINSASLEALTRTRPRSRIRGHLGNPLLLLTDEEVIAQEQSIYARFCTLTIHQGHHIALITCRQAGASRGPRIKYAHLGAALGFRSLMSL